MTSLKCCDQVAPRYVPSGVRVMVYFRLQLSLPVDVLLGSHRNETCKEVSWHSPWEEASSGVRRKIDV